jgi:hypothetical protein
VSIVLSLLTLIGKIKAENDLVVFEGYMLIQDTVLKYKNSEKISSYF